MVVFQITTTKLFIDEADTKTYGLYSSFSKAMDATKSIKLNSKYGEYLEIRQITLDCPYPEYSNYHCLLYSLCLLLRSRQHDL